MSFNFLNLLKPDAHLARNGFDLSQKHVFSDKAGHACPCLAIETVPNDKFVIDMAGLVRTQTFNTAAFVRGKFAYDFFFVPYSQLWHPFNQFITQRDDAHTTRQLGSRYVPNVLMKDVLLWIGNEYDCFLHDSGYVEDVHGEPVCLGAVRLLDMLGYGNFQWLLDKVYEAEGMTDDVKELCEDFSQSVNVFRLAAYQHIFYDWYRNKYYDVADTGGIDAFTETTYYKDYLSFFNWDDIDCSSFATSRIFNAFTDIDWVNQSVNLENRSYLRLAGLLTIRYTQFKKDLYTASLPSQQFGAVSSVDINGVHLVNDMTGSSTSSVTISSSAALFPDSAYAASRPGSYSWSIPSAFDVLQLRKAEALEKWKMNTLRAGNQVQDSWESHFGTHSKFEGHNCVTFLGSFESRLDVNTVTSQSAGNSTSPNNQVGDLAATGTSVISGQKVRFDSSDFGVILCISTFVPDVDYEANMIDKANRLFEPFDFYNSEFQNIGMDDVVIADFDYTYGLGVRNANVVVGKAPRYWHYKTALDKVHGEFNRRSLRHWVAPRIDSFLPNASGSRPLAALYVNPSFFDSVFGVVSDAYQNTDYFLHNVYFDVKAIRPMSELGLPQF